MTAELLEEHVKAKSQCVTLEGVCILYDIRGKMPGYVSRYFETRFNGITKDNFLYLCCKKI